MFTTLISAGELALQIGNPDWRIFDARFSLAVPDKGRRDYQRSHIPGALYAHLEEDLSGPVIPGITGRHPLPEVEWFAERLGRWGVNGESQVVVYDDLGGAIAARLWWMLHWLGHRAAAVLDGGWQAWLSGGYPVSADVPAPDAAVFEPHLREGLLATTAEVVSMASNLVDSRAPERYRGQREPIDPVAGHIPGAINAFHGLTAGADGRFLSPEALRKHFESIPGLRPGATFYCGSGVTACRNILAMVHAGLGDARLYAGSWSEWITDPLRPVAREEPV